MGPREGRDCPLLTLSAWTVMGVLVPGKSCVYEQGCVTDPVLARHREQAGRSSPPSWLEGSHFRDVSLRFLEQCGISLPPVPIIAFSSVLDT